MKEALDNAKEELKRVDHLFYVSLKYTRTADMMRHLIERLINAFSFGIESLLKYAKEEKIISHIPDSPTMRANLFLETFKEEEAINYINLYLKLRKIIRADYSRKEEYRRHVAMTCKLEKGEISEVNIDVLKEYYETAKNFINYAQRKIEGEEEF